MLFQLSNLALLLGIGISTSNAYTITYFSAQACEGTNGTLSSPDNVPPNGTSCSPFPFPVQSMYLVDFTDTVLAMAADHQYCAGGQEEWDYEAEGGYATPEVCFEMSAANLPDGILYYELRSGNS